MFKKENIIFGLGVLYILLCLYFTWINMSILSMISIGLLAVFFAVFYTEYSFLALAFFTPISINIEEYTDSFGLYLPTEPLLFGIMLLLLFQQLKSKIIDSNIFQNKLIWIVLTYIFWIFITSITSINPLVSFKFLLAKLWFIIPVLFFGTIVFRKFSNIKIFFWLYIFGMVIVMIYTVLIHASYNFGEKEGHWVMFPFFKDHTIYGCMVAFILPVLIGFLLSKKYSPINQLFIVVFVIINLIALYFSYTRAAWLSIFAAFGVWFLLLYKIKFKWILSFVVPLSLVLYLSWHEIQMELERNKSEHTTENFDERLQSATNVSTDASNLERLNRWSCAIDMFKERPLFGFGPGTYAFEYARFQRPENLTIISTNFGNGGNAHSEYLGPLAEMGLMGLIIMIALVIVIFYKGINLYIKWPKEETENRRILLALNLALVTYFVHGIINNYFDSDKASIPIWAICACFIAQEIELNKKRVTLK